MLPEGSNAQLWDIEHLRMATEAAGVALWSWNVDTDDVTLDRHARCLWHLTHSDTVITFESLSERVHPGDLPRLQTALEAAQVTPGAYEVDFRILTDGHTRWLSARGKGAGAGMIGPVLFAVFLDVTERKQADMMHEMLVGEMSHRIKNLFAVTSALAAIAARSAATPAEMARDLAQRLDALGRANDLVRPIPGGKMYIAAVLQDLIQSLLAPYADGPATANRIQVSVPALRVGEHAITTLALVIHELATNSAKYGALSSETGTIEVAGSEHGEHLVLVWTERGGPTVAASPQLGGFGSKLVRQSMSGQLGGSIAFAWPPTGLAATLTMNKARLAL